MADASLITTISEAKECVTLINTCFTAGSQDQDEVVKLLIDTGEEVMRHQPGFISANIHQSYDGSAITNYVQWRSSEHLDAALQKSEVQEHIILFRRRKSKTALYQVIYVLHASDSIANNSV